MIEPYAYGGTYIRYNLFNKGDFAPSNNYPAPTESLCAQPESAKEKRDRLSREENKRLIEARKRGGKIKF